MVSLKDKVAVVGGGTGRVGEGIVKSFLTAGANVVVPVRSEGKAKRLEEYIADVETGSLTCLPADVSDFESAMNLLKTRDRGGQSMPDWISAEQIGDYIIRLSEGKDPQAEETAHKLFTIQEL